MTFWTGGEGTLNVTIGIGTGAFSISGTFFVVTSLVSSEVQKKESSETRFGIGDVDDVGALEGVATSFVFSALGIQKKNRSMMGFMHGVTSEEMSFMGGAIRRVTTC